MRKFILSVATIAATCISAPIAADACPQAVRRERVRVVQPRQRVQRQVVREKVVVREQVQYVTPVRERIIVREQLNTECQSGCQVQEFRSNFVRSY